MYIRDNRDGTTQSFNFIAPEGAEKSMNEVLFPTADVKTLTGESEIEVKAMQTFVQKEDIVKDLTLEVSVHEQVTPGAKVHLKLTADQTSRTITLTGAVEDEITVAASATVCREYVYDGVDLLPTNS
ncbi:MAG: hypothetical protein ACK5L5_03515 [Bacteroidales bacterium]